MSMCVLGLLNYCVHLQFWSRPIWEQFSWDVCNLRMTLRLCWIFVTKLCKSIGYIQLPCIQHPHWLLSIFLEQGMWLLGGEILNTIFINYSWGHFRRSSKPIFCKRELISFWNVNLFWSLTKPILGKLGLISSWNT